MGRLPEVGRDERSRTTSCTPTAPLLGCARKTSARLSPPAVEALLAVVAVNVLLGNGEAHGRNLSLLHSPTGDLMLAPLYDLLCTLAYGDDRLAMYVDDVRRTHRVTTDRIVDEAVRWGMSGHQVEATVAELVDRTPAVAAAAQDESPGLALETRRLVLPQQERLCRWARSRATAGEEAPR